MPATLAGFRAYALERGDAAPTNATDVDASAALLRAQDHITYTYVQRFASGFDGESANVEPAIYEAAILELATPGFFTTTYTPAQQKVLTKVDSIEWTVVGGASGTEAATPTSTKIAAMLRPYMFYGVGMIVV